MFTHTELEALNRYLTNDLPHPGLSTRYLSVMPQDWDEAVTLSELQCNLHLTDQE